MENEILVRGPFKPYSLFIDFSHFIGCKIVPTSVGGNPLCPKFYEKFNDIIVKNRNINNITDDISDLNFLGGNLFIRFVNYHVGTNYKYYYYLSIIKVCIKFQEKDDLRTVTPLESNTITSNSLEELELRYELFKGTSENGFEGNFFGKLNVKGSSSDFTDLINSYTFDNDFKSLLNSELDHFLFDIWSSIGTVPLHELADLNSEHVYRSIKPFYLENVWMELSGCVHEYLSSDVMVLPNHLKSTKFSNVEEFSDFSEYSDSDDPEDSERAFDFSNEAFVNFFNKVSESIKGFGGSVLPYINGSYLQDGCWIINNSTVCHDLRDVILLLKGSTTWQKERKPDDNNCKLKLFLYKIPHFNKSAQFRVFTYDSKVVLISQLFFNNVYDYLLKRDEEFSRLKDHILMFHTSKIVKHLPKNASKFVIDLYVINKSDEIYVTNISPWNVNDENLFSWEEIYEYVTAGKEFDHDESVKVTYFSDVAFVILLSNKLSRHNLYSFCPEDVEELAKITSS